MKIIKKILIVILVLLTVLILFALGYVVFLQTGYYRIPDNLAVETNNQVDEKLNIDEKYSAVTFNVGFGAYDKDFSFFMDSGETLLGEKTQGDYGKGRNKEDVTKNITSSANIAKELSADFYLFQEVDINSSRSYKINQREILEEKLQNLSSSFSSNFHSRYLLYPFPDFHGSVESGIQTTSKYNINSSNRMSYTVDTSFITKFFDLDRCFMIHRLEIVGTEKELVMINHHMSAYDKGGLIREKQLKEIFDVVQSEYEKGNYVILGGDFNHILSEPNPPYKTEEKKPEWVVDFPLEQLPDGFSVVVPENLNEASTCRSSDVPYIKGINYEATIDGFIVSDNIIATAKTIDKEYLYSDHNPVFMEFEFKK